MSGFNFGVSFNSPTNTKKNPRVRDNAVNGNDFIIFLQNIFLVLNSKKSQWTSMSVFIDFSLNNCNFNLTFRIID
jgi:hypothetical protein